MSLGAHVIGARTVESILQLYPVKLTRNLKAEFYGKKFVLLAPETPRNLRQVRLPGQRRRLSFPGAPTPLPPPYG